MKEKEKQGKTKFQTIFKEIKDNPQKKAIVILGCYFVFFVFVIIFIRIGNNNQSNYIDNNNSYSNYFSLEKIKLSNYHFKYDIVLDSNTIIYEGDKTNRESTFIEKRDDLENNYYESDDIYLMMQDSNWVEVNNPYPFSTLFNGSNIEKIIEDATYISKTFYDNSKYEYKYEITTTTLLKILNRQIVDLDLNPNQIIIVTNSNKEIEEITFDLTSYTNYLNLSQTLGKVTLRFSRYGLVDDIKNPIDTE